MMPTARGGLIVMAPLMRFSAGITAAAATLGAGLAAVLATLWRMTWIVAAVAAASYLPLVLILAALLMLLRTSQGTELGRVLAEAGAGPLIGLVAACLLWGVANWYWARRPLDARFGHRSTWTRVSFLVVLSRRIPDLPASLAAIGMPAGQVEGGQGLGWMRGMLGTVVVWTPRLYAAAPFVIAFVLLWRTGGGAFWTIALVALALLMLLSLRRHLPLLAIWQRIGRWALWIAPIYSLAVILAFTIWPIALGRAFGAIGAVFMFFSALLAPLGWAAAWAARWRVPAALMLFGLLLLLPWLDPDRHMVRRLSDAPLPERLTMTQALDSWRRVHADDVEPRFVVVTAAGGGISAAVWTGLILAAVEDRQPGFAGRIFAISAVSGGALGAAAFAAATIDDAPPTAAAQAVCSDGALARLGACRRAGAIHAALAPDFLGPLFAAYVFRDTFGPLAFQRGNDRAAVLERAWEDACATAGCPALRGSFLALRPSTAGVPAPWRPLLAFNGTHVETGKRIITSQLRITLGHFDDAFDFFDVFRRDVALSTAVTNAARFPYVTPAGTLGAWQGQIADGGYFENYGSETGGEIMRAAIRYFGGPEQKIVRPIFVEISSDPSLPPRDAWRADDGIDAIGLRCTDAGSEPVPLSDDSMLPLMCSDAEDRGLGLGQLSAPVDVFMATRSGRGVQAARRVWQEARIARAVRVRFTLCRQGSPERPPLGWSLSRATREAIAEDVVRLFDVEPAGEACHRRNRANMETLLRALAPTPAR